MRVLHESVTVTVDAATVAIHVACDLERGVVYRSTLLLPVVDAAAFADGLARYADGKWPQALVLSDARISVYDVPPFPEARMEIQRAADHPHGYYDTLSVYLPQTLATLVALLRDVAAEHAGN